MTDLDFDEKKGQLDEIIAEAKARKERAGEHDAKAKAQEDRAPVLVADHAARTEAAAAEDRFARMLAAYRARRKEVDRTPMPEEQKKELESRLDEIDGLLKDEHVALRGGVAMPPPLPWVGQDEPTHPHVDLMPDRPGFAASRTVPGEGKHAGRGKAGEDKHGIPAAGPHAGPEGGPAPPPQVAHGVVAPEAAAHAKKAH